MRTEFILPKIYPITDRQVSGVSHSEQVRRFIDGGATVIQVRDKHAASRELFRDVEECLEIARANGVKLIVNDRVDIALALKADGVHLGQGDLPPAEARTILGNEAIIGFSTHSLTQALEACELPIDYIAIGPIFGTRTKLDHEEPVGIEVINAVKRAIGEMPLVAIGGIGIGDMKRILSEGADSAALVSALLSESEQIAENTRSGFAITSALDLR